jgi:hypothetical protein
VIGSWYSSITEPSGSSLGERIFLDLAVGQLDAVAHRRRRLHEVEVVLALEPLLDDLHVQQAEEAAAEAEAERVAGLGLERERAVVEAQLLERLAQVLVLARLSVG